MQYEIYGNCLVMHIADDLDHCVVSGLREQSDGLIEENHIRHIIFDFTDVHFMDSSGIGLIMGRYKKVMFVGGRAAVTNVGKTVDRIFRLSGLYQMIERFDAVPDALQAFQGKKREGVRI